MSVEGKTALKVGSLVHFHDDERDPDYEVVLDIYDDDVFHALDSTGGVMQYNLKDIIRTAPETLDITNEMDSITKKLQSYNQSKRSD